MPTLKPVLFYSRPSPPTIAGAKTTVYEVTDPLQLPFAAQCMVQKAGVSVVVAIGFLVADAHWCSKEVRRGGGGGGGDGGLDGEGAGVVLNAVCVRPGMSYLSAAHSLFPGGGGGMGWDGMVHLRWLLNTRTPRKKCPCKARMSSLFSVFLILS